MPANDNRSPLRPFVLGGLVLLAVAGLLALLAAV